MQNVPFIDSPSITDSSNKIVTETTCSSLNIPKEMLQRLLLATKVRERCKLTKLVQCAMCHRLFGSRISLQLTLLLNQLLTDNKDSVVPGDRGVYGNCFGRSGYKVSANSQYLHYPVTAPQIA